MSRILTITASLAVTFMAALALISPAHAVSSVTINCNSPGINSGDYLVTDDVEFTTENCYDVFLDGDWLLDFSTVSIPLDSLDAIDDPNRQGVAIDFYDENSELALHLEIYQAAANSNGNNNNSDNTIPPGDAANQNPEEASDVTPLLAQTGQEETLLFNTASLAVVLLVAGAALISLRNRTRSKGIHNA